jgi:hypothetical protein
VYKITEITFFLSHKKEKKKKKKNKLKIFKINLDGAQIKTKYVTRMNY